MGTILSAINVNTAPQTNQSEKHSVSFIWNQTCFGLILQQSFILRIHLYYTFSFKMHMPTKKYLRKKTNELCLMDRIVIESYSFLEYW